jgi:tRNA (cmo5U34)-methyltransferase
MGKSQEEVDKHLARFGVEYFPITIEDHLKLLKETGFKNVELFWCSYMQAGFYGIK